MICFHFSIFEPLETTKNFWLKYINMLWFAFILVSLNHWKQLEEPVGVVTTVVICFHFSIFEPLETTSLLSPCILSTLWFAFILVSLNHWKQPSHYIHLHPFVVICFHFSIFEPLETTSHDYTTSNNQLWFAFILVSLNHWKQLFFLSRFYYKCCDLLSF